MKVSHKLAKLIKNLYLSKQYGARSLLSELSDKETWKYWQSAEENPHDGYSPATRQRWTAFTAYQLKTLCSVGGQAKKAPISSWNFAWNCHSPFKCAPDNSPRSPAQMLQTMSCSAVVRSQSHLSFHSLINNLIVCTKSCYCFLLNHKLNDK